MNKIKHYIPGVFLAVVLFLTPMETFPATPVVKTYVLSYSPGTLFHQLVKNRTRDVYRRAGLKAEFKPVPHNRSLVSANAGTVDGDVGRVPSIEETYPDLRRVNVKLMDLKGAVYTTHEDIRFYSEDLLEQYRVGCVLGVRWTKKKMEGITITTTKDYQTLFKMLLSDRIDIVLATEASADAVLSELGDKALKIYKLEPFVFSAPIYHYVNKKNESVISRLEKALAELVQEGFWD